MTLHSAQKKKVIILTVKNIGKKASYQYLEASITESIQKKLHEKFEFEEANSDLIDEVAKNNYIFPEDFHTKTGSLNLGLLSQQDVVISGGFKIKTKKKKVAGKKGKKKKIKKSTKIITTIRIYDLKKKEIIAEFSQKGPADSRIFKSVEKIVDRIIKEAAAVLPSKEEWARTGADSGESEPIFGRYTLGFRAGGALYLKGWGDFWTPDQQAFTLTFRMNLSILLENLFFYSEMFYMKQTMKSGTNTTLNKLNLVGNATNLIPAGYFGYEIPFMKKFAVTPKIGGGIVLQQLKANGQFTAATDNSFPFIGGGADVSYSMSKHIALVTSLQTLAEMESGVITYLNLFSFGANYEF